MDLLQILNGLAPNIEWTCSKYWMDLLQILNGLAPNIEWTCSKYWMDLLQILNGLAPLPAETLFFFYWTQTQLDTPQIRLNTTLNDKSKWIRTKFDWIRPLPPPKAFNRRHWGFTSVQAVSWKTYATISTNSTKSKRKNCNRIALAIPIFFSNLMPFREIIKHESYIKWIYSTIFIFLNLISASLTHHIFYAQYYHRTHLFDQRYFQKVSCVKSLNAILILSDLDLWHFLFISFLIIYFNDIKKIINYFFLLIKTEHWFLRYF